MAIARFHNEGDLPEEPPLTRRQGGIIAPLMTTAEKNQRQHTEALNNLADAIRELAEAITSRNPTTPEATPDDSASPGPAKGLVTQVRPTPEHRDRRAPGNRYFGPVTAGGDPQ